MRNAYALLGLSFLIVFGGAYVLFRQSAEAPATTPADTDSTATSTGDILNVTE